MRLIVGLGNPGKKYIGTFHNIGFQVVDLLSEFLFCNSQKKQFQSLVFQGQYEDSHYLLMKPETFMNLSGNAVVACKNFYKISIEDIIVISDDINLPLAQLRYRKSGSHGGHNGLRNIIAQCGSDQFHRLRIGVGKPEKHSLVDYVLNKPKKEQSVLIEDAIKKAVPCLVDFIVKKSVQIVN